MPSTATVQRALRPARRSTVASLALTGLALITAAGGFAVRSRFPGSASAPALHPTKVASVAPAPDGAGPAQREGDLPSAASPFASDLPGIANLQPDLLAAVRAASRAADAAGVHITVTSGWRSAALQRRLLREAIAEHGSAEAAARWVATPETSVHVAGGAVDLGPTAAWPWLAQHGTRYGLCRIYDNEPWHYELRPAAIERGCPPPYPDPTFDPRLRQPD